MQRYIVDNPTGGTTMRAYIVRGESRENLMAAKTWAKKIDKSLPAFNTPVFNASGEKD